MFTRALRKICCAVACLLFVISCAGCDKLSFLADYFPSLQKERPAAVSPVVSEPGPAPAAQRPLAPRGDVLARVGSWTLTKQEFDERLQAVKELVPEYDVTDPESKRMILAELVRQELLVQDAERRGIDRNKDIVDAVNEFRRTLLVREVVEELTQGIDTPVTEARQYYDQNRDLFAEATEWRVREIVVSTQSEANELLITLLQGADFAATAQGRSRGATAAQGGDKGFISTFDFPQMESAALTLDVGGISSVFRGPDGFYIVKLEETRGGEAESFAEVREDIQAGLTMLKQQQVVLDYIGRLEQTADIEINDNLL